MPTITLKNIPESLHQRLRQSAERHRRSLNKEILALLEERLATEDENAELLLQEIEAFQTALPSVDHTLVDDFKRGGRA